MPNRAGKIFDVNTGSLISETDDFTRDFLYYVRELQRKGKPFFAATGACRAQGHRETVDAVRDMGVTVVFRRDVKPDVMYLLEGKPEDFAE